MKFTKDYANFTGRIGVSSHAIDEAVKDLKYPRLVAEDRIRSDVRKAKFISVVYDKDGRPGRLFAHQGVSYIMGLDEHVVVTVYPRHTSAPTLHSRIEAVIARELRKLERKERATERHAAVEKARLAVEAANCRLKMVMTPSKAVIRRNTDRLAQIDEEFAELDRKLAEIRREKSTFAKGIVRYV